MLQTRLAQLSFLTAAALAAIMGCSSEQHRPGANGAQLTPEEYCRKSAQQVCGSLAACCSTSVEACVEQKLSTCSESADNSLRKGLLFNADAAQQCVDATAGAYLDCALLPLDDPRAALALNSCAAVFSAGLNPGASCTFDGACRGGEALTGQCSSAGKCTRVPVLALGAACDDREKGVCTSDAHCDGTCQKPKAVGQKCASAGECASRWCENNQCVLIPKEVLCIGLAESQ
jgi:hypothetical protein